MKAAKLVKIGMEMLKVLSENGIKFSDWQYVGAYESFLSMRQSGIKHRAAITILAKKNKTSERTLERVFKRLSQVVN